MPLTLIEQNVLLAKGLTADQLDKLGGFGVEAKSDFATIGNAATLMELMPGLEAAVAAKVMEWAVGAPAPAVTDPGKVFLDSADVVYCVHCHARQPKDYKTGELCTSCGKQAEPVQACHWCASTGPGKFCRGCGAEFVPLAEYNLALLLKREGVAKDEIAQRLKTMTPVEKDVLWGRVNRVHG